MKIQIDMKRLMSFCSGLLCFACLLVGTTGCQSEGEGESNTAAETPAEPETFASVLEKIESAKTEVCTAFAAGTPEEAHGVLHTVGHMLESLPTLAASDLELSDDQMTKLKAAVEGMFDGFGEFDGSLHDGGEVDTTALETKLTEYLAEIKAMVE